LHLEVELYGILIFHIKCTHLTCLSLEFYIASLAYLLDFAYVSYLGACIIMKIQHVIKIKKTNRHVR